MQTQSMRPMPFTEEQMRQIYNTNLIDFAVRHGFEVEKGDVNTVHVKHSGGLYLFKHGRGYKCFSTQSKGNIVDFVKEYMGAADFKSAAEIILNCRAYENTEHYIPPMEKKPRGDLVLPPKDKSFDRTIAYLTRTRGIDKEIVYAMIDQGKVYVVPLAPECGRHGLLCGGQQKRYSPYPCPELWHGADRKNP